MYYVNDELVVYVLYVYQASEHYFIWWLYSLLAYFNTT
jgi:hypothetical protein